MSQKNIFKNFTMHQLKKRLHDVEFFYFSEKRQFQKIDYLGALMIFAYKSEIKKRSMKNEPNKNK